MVPWESWVELFKGREWVSVGAGPRRYPEDMVALYRWPDRLKGHLHMRHSSPLPGLDWSEFQQLLD